MAENQTPAEAAAYLRTLTPWDFQQEQWEATARCLCAAADEIERLRFALRLVAGLPVAEQDNLMAANMRAIAREAL